MFCILLFATDLHDYQIRPVIMILYCTSEFASVMVSYLLPPYMARIDGWARGPCSLDASLDDIAQKRWHRVSSGSCGCILAKLGYQTVCRLTTPPSKKKKNCCFFFFCCKNKLCIGERSFSAQMQRKWSKADASFRTDMSFKSYFLKISRRK